MRIDKDNYRRWEGALFLKFFLTGNLDPKFLKEAVITRSKFKAALTGLAWWIWIAETNAFGFG